VMVYDETQTGNNRLPYGILAGSNSQISAPVALSVGNDFPCGANGCQQYLWVSNAGNNTLTYYTLPLTSWNQAPSGVISGNDPSCGPQFSNPYGIVHVGPYNNNTTSGQILQTSETNQSGDYYIVGWNAVGNGPSSCDALHTNPGYLSPSGPSIYVTSNAYNVFNANSRTITETSFTPLNTWGPTSSWSVAGGTASTEGTAVQQGTAGFVWATTNANQTYTEDALWRCKIGAFPNCPATPVCVNPGAGLDFPDFPSISAAESRIYVPNQNNGTVTSYKLAANCVLKTTYVNLVSPFGTAVQF
jgi:hypothetical protein